MGFIFTVCQVGAESALKSEIAGGYPNLKFAYSRPGFLTFKAGDGGSGEPEPDFILRTVFARAYGLSIGKAARPEEAFAHARQLAARFGSKPRLHVFERDAFAPGDETKDYVMGAQSRQALDVLRRSAEFEPSFAVSPEPVAGDVVLDLIYLDPDCWWLGYHRHTAHHSPWPGGQPEIAEPALAPSRAYLKLEEAIRWSSAPVRAGDVAIEIGSAPGGASFALLERGLDVIGIDPADMAESVRAFGPTRFKHLKKPAAQVRRNELPDVAHWILLDMNVAPVISLNTVERIAPWFQDSLQGLVLTLKLNEWKHAAEIPKLLRRVEKLGMARIRASQLASNKQEICVVALTRAGVARRPGLRPAPASPSDPSNSRSRPRKP